MKLESTLTVMFRHNLWANLRILEACRGLSEEQFNSSIDGVYGTIWDTLRHIFRAELSYFSRVSTGEPYHHSDETPTFDDLIASAKLTGEGLIEWATKIQPEDTARFEDWDNQMIDVPKSIVLNQVINHATEHRAQIMSMLTHLGIEPPELDSWTYFDKKGNE